MWRVDSRWQDCFNDMHKELSAIKERVARVEGRLSGAPGLDRSRDAA